MIRCMYTRYLESRVDMQPLLHSHTFTFWLCETNHYTWECDIIIWFWLARVVFLPLIKLWFVFSRFRIGGFSNDHND